MAYDESSTKDKPSHTGNHRQNGGNTRDKPPHTGNHRKANSGNNRDQLQHTGKHRQNVGKARDQPQHTGNHRQANSGNTQDQPTHTGNHRQANSGNNQDKPPLTGNHRQANSGENQDKPPHTGNHRQASSGNNQDKPPHTGNHRQDSSGNNQDKPTHTENHRQTNSGNNQDKPPHIGNQRQANSGNNQVKPPHIRNHRQANSGRERRDSPLHGRFSQAHVNITCASLPSEDRVFRNILLDELARQNPGKVSPSHFVENSHSKKNLAKDTSRRLIQREDLEKMRNNKALLHTMKTSICALSRLAEEVGRNVRDVSTQQRTATNLWKTLTAKFGEMSKKLHEESLPQQEKSSGSHKKRQQKLNSDDGYQPSELHLERLVFPKIDTTSRSNSTVSIIEMQESKQHDQSEKVSVAKVSHIKKIARKRSQDKALKDVDLESEQPGNGSPDLLQSARKHALKIKQERRQYIEKRLREMEEFQENYILSGKEPSTHDNIAAPPDDQSRYHDDTIHCQTRNADKHNNGNHIWKC